MQHCHNLPNVGQFLCWTPVTVDGFNSINQSVQYLPFSAAFRVCKGMFGPVQAKEHTSLDSKFNVCFHISFCRSLQQQFAETMSASFATGNMLSTSISLVWTYTTYV